MKLLLFFFLVSASRVAPAETVSFCAVGDILLDRHIRQIIGERGPDYPLALVKPFIQGHDLAFCNVESSLSTRGTRVRGLWRFRGEPEWASMLSAAGFNLGCVANNHTLDYGREAFVDSMEALRKAGLTPIGGGGSQAEALEAVYLKRGDLTVAFLGNEEVPLDGFTDRPEHVRLPGPAQASVQALERAIRRAKQQADVVILSQHWGHEYRSQPSASQVERAHRYIDAGASLLIGHHPHVLQPVESYHGGLILYSLGNFVFDQRHNIQTQSVIFECELAKDGLRSPRLRPLRIRDFRPAPAGPQDAGRILAWIQEISRPFATGWALSGTALAYALPPAGQFQALAAGGELLLDSRGVHWSPAGGPVQHWDAPAGMKLTLGAGQSEDGVFRVYSLLTPQGKAGADQLAAFTLADGKLQGPLFYPQALKAWKLALVDVDDDGRAELCVGVRRGQGSAARRQLLVLERGRTGLRPKAMGKAVGGDIEDFSHARVDGRTTVVLLEREAQGQLRSVLYGWERPGYRPILN